MLDASAASSIDLYTVKKMDIFQHFGNSNFHADIRIQLEKLNILMCISTRLRQTMPNPDFFIYHQDAPERGKSTLGSNFPAQLTTRIVGTRSCNSKLSNFCDSINMILS